MNNMLLENYTECVYYSILISFQIYAFYTFRYFIESLKVIYMLLIVKITPNTWYNK